MLATCAAPVAYDYAAQPLVPVPTCPVCGHPNRARPAYDRYGYRVTLSQCPCGLIYFNPRLTAEGYSQFYREVYRALLADYRGPVADPHDARTRGRLIGQALKTYGAPGGTVLDVGGGTGQVGIAVAEVLGATVTVLDPNATELAEAAARGCQTVQGCVETLPASAMQYDVIVCTKTADHWWAPMDALRWMRAALAPGGWLWIDIVDAREWMKQWPLATWKIDHPVYWNRRSIERALALTGWRIHQQVWLSDARGRDRCRPVYLCRGA